MTAARFVPVFVTLWLLGGCVAESTGDCIEGTFSRSGTVTITEVTIDVDPADVGLHPDANCPLDVTLVRIAGDFVSDDAGLASPVDYDIELPKASRACLESLDITAGDATAAVRVASDPHSPCAPSVSFVLPVLEAAWQTCAHTCP